MRKDQLGLDHKEHLAQLVQRGRRVLAAQRDLKAHQAAAQLERKAPLVHPELTVRMELLARPD